MSLTSTANHRTDRHPPGGDEAATTEQAAISPLETQRQALDLPVVQAIYAAMRIRPRGGADEMCARLITAACDGAGIELGGYDRRIIAWLAGWEPQICAVVAGLIARAAVAGRSRSRPSCRTCGEWLGRFDGIAGWRHWRYDLDADARVFWAGDHEPEVEWAPVRDLSPAALSLLSWALADAISWREPSGECTACNAHPAGLCGDHSDDLDLADAYATLARQLGVEADR